MQRLMISGNGKLIQWQEKNQGDDVWFTLGLYSPAEIREFIIRGVMTRQLIQNLYQRLEDCSGDDLTDGQLIDMIEEHL